MFTRLRRHVAVVRGAYELDAELAALQPQRCGWCRDVTVEPGEGIYVHTTAYCSTDCYESSERADRLA